MQKYKNFAPDIFNVIQQITENNFSESSLSLYASLDKISFDYIFAENPNPHEAYVINAEMGWSDIGELIALKEALEDKLDDVVSIGNTFDVDSQDCLVYNTEPKKLVTTMNLQNMVVVNTPDVVAIFPKDDNGKIKELLSLLEKEGKEEFL